MKLNLILPVKDYDALQDKLDTIKTPFVRIDRQVFALLMKDYERLCDACQRAGVDLDVCAPVHRIPKRADKGSAHDNCNRDDRKLAMEQRS